MKQPRIFIIGDSTAQTNDSTTFPQTGWGQTLPLFLKKGTEVFNFAKNGQSSRSFLESGLFSPVEKELSKSDILLIQFGHNDQKPDALRHTDPFTTYPHYLEHYIGIAHQKGALPVLMTSITRRQFGQDGHLLPKTHFDYPEAVRAVAKKQSIPCLDMYTLSWSLIDSLGDVDSKHLFMHLPAGKYPHYPEGLSDNTHFVYEGAVTMARLIAKSLQSLGSPYSDLVIDGLAD